MKISVLALLMAVTLLGVEFDYRGEVTLKKDAWYQLQVKSEKSTLLAFRWTLYVNDELVLLRRYDDFNHHHMLTLHNRRNLVRFKVASSRSRIVEDSYMYIKFKAFDLNRSEATFELLLRDKNKNVELEFIEND